MDEHVHGALHCTRWIIVAWSTIHYVRPMKKEVGLMQNQEPWQAIQLPLAPTNTIMPTIPNSCRTNHHPHSPITYVAVPQHGPLPLPTKLDDPSNPKTGFLVPTVARPLDDGSFKRPLTFLTVPALGPTCPQSDPFTLHMLRDMSIMPPQTLIRSIHTATPACTHAHDDTCVLY